MNSSDWKQYIIVGLFVLMVLGAKWYIVSEEQVDVLPEKLYVAAEGDGKIAVVDPATMTLVKNIDLSLHGHGGPVVYRPHNVQVSPNGSSVWVTANAGSHSHGFKFIPKAHADAGMSAGTSNDQIIVIDPKSDEIVKRIDIASGLHLAHVALTSDGRYAYISGQTSGKIYKINALTYLLEQTIDVGGTTEPHGLRVSADDNSAYVAMLKGNSLGVLNLSTNNFKNIKLEGAPVQTGVTANGKYAFASVYDKKSVAVYEIATQKISYVRLPADASGPVQLYPTPDSNYLYVADQGYYFDQPTGKFVYKIDLRTMAVVKTIAGGAAPHGMVVSKDGSRAYVTNLLSNDVSVIDVASDKIMKNIPVGKEPNGISLWSKESGGTP